MRRRAAAVLLCALLVPAAMSFAAGAAARASSHCGAACPLHRTGRADCCPAETSPQSGCSLRRCLPSEDPVLVPFSTVTPQTLRIASELLPPPRSGDVPAAPSAALLAEPLRTPDHVPLPSS